mgnify:CR=1 FL=1
MQDLRLAIQVIELPIRDGNVGEMVVGLDATSVIELPIRDGNKS